MIDEGQIDAQPGEVDHHGAAAGADPHNEDSLVRQGVRLDQPLGGREEVLLKGHHRHRCLRPFSVAAYESLENLLRRGIVLHRPERRPSGGSR